jgi:hypothetical protein
MKKAAVAFVRKNGRFLACLALLVFALWASEVYSERSDCEKLKASGTETNVSWKRGCQAKIDGQWTVVTRSFLPRG